MEFRPAFDKLLVEQESNENIVGGIYIPDTSTNLKKGIVAAAGPDVTIAGEGSRVLFAKDAGTLITIDGRQYLVIVEKDVWMID